MADIMRRRARLWAYSWRRAEPRALGDFVKQRGLRSVCSVENNLFQNRNVLQITLPPQSGDSVYRLLTFPVGHFRETHQHGFLKHLQVPVQIAIGQRTQ